MFVCSRAPEFSDDQTPHCRDRAFVAAAAEDKGRLLLFFTMMLCPAAITTIEGD